MARRHEARSAVANYPVMKAFLRLTMTDMQRRAYLAHRAGVSTAEFAAHNGITQRQAEFYRGHVTEQILALPDSDLRDAITEGFAGLRATADADAVAVTWDARATAMMKLLKAAKRRRPRPLTARQEQVLVCFFAGYSDRELSSWLKLNKSTVREHRQSALRRIDSIICSGIRLSRNRRLCTNLIVLAEDPMNYRKTAPQLGLTSWFQREADKKLRRLRPKSAINFAAKTNSSISDSACIPE